MTAAVPANSAQNNPGPRDFVLVACRSVHGAGSMACRWLADRRCKAWACESRSPPMRFAETGMPVIARAMGGSDLDALPGSCGAQSRGAIPAVEFSRALVPSNPPCNWES